MISNQTQREVGVNSASTSEFSIKNSAKMFNMIISGLYSDKPQSITREIWSNAYDAHCMVGKPDLPFLVTMPTPLVTTFTCRDFGTGIHHKDMEGLYTVLGHSTKEDTNDAVGKWGVGRMSPMSYTDSFTVVSRHEGMKTYYSVQIGTDGAPRLHTLVPPQASDEPSGLEVSFPIQRKDIHLFEQAAKRVALGFSVKPAVEGYDTYPWDTLTPSLSGTGWQYLNNGSRLLGDGYHAKMGCVIYPIKGVDDLPRLYGGSLLFEFDIGALEVTASREDLSYGRNDPTKDAILKAYKTHLEEAESLYLDAIKTAPTMWDAVTASNSKPRTLKLNYSFTPTWKGEDVHSSNVLTDSLFDLASWTTYSSYDVRYKQTNLSFASLERKPSLGNNYHVYVSVGTGQDRDVRAGVRILDDWHTSGNKVCVLWAKVEDKATADKVMLGLKSRMGNSHTYKFVSDLSDKGPQATTRTATKIKMCVGNSSEYYDYTMDDAEFKVGGVYLPIANNAPLEGEHNWRSVKNLMRYAGVIGDNLVVVPKTQLKKFEDSPDWTPLFTKANDFISVDKEEKVAWGLEAHKRETDGAERINSLKVSCGLIKTFQGMIIKDKEQVKWGLTRTSMYSLFIYLGMPLAKSDEKFSATQSLIYKTYPLLQHFNHISDVGMYQDYVDGMVLLRGLNTQSKAA